MENKRVLILSVGCWNRKTGSDTFSSLMAGYGAEKVANIYIREDLPDSDVCSNYFRISENAVIKSLFKRGVKTGERVEATVSEEISDNAAASAERYKKYSAKRSYLLLYARELIWKFGRWKTPELDKFIEEFKPETVFFSMEGYIHLDRIARYVIKKTGAKGVGYFWDDNFTYKQSKSFGHNFYRFFQRRELKKCVKACSEFFAITPKTKQEADEFFGIDCKILTKPIKTEGGFVSYEPKTPLKILYTGKLIIGRYDTVKVVGEALDRLNVDGVKAELDVYTTTELSAEQKETLSPFVHILGAIPQNEVAEKQNAADILLFAEAISGEASKIARLSFSTKITDYLRSGKCILAVGDLETAPMEYLRDEDAALVADNAEGIFESLSLLCENRELVLEYAKKAHDCGIRNHKKEDIQKLLFDTLNS